MRARDEHSIPLSWMPIEFEIAILDLNNLDFNINQSGQIKRTLIIMANRKLGLNENVSKRRLKSQS